MKTIKPLSLGILQRTFETARQPYFMVGLFATFSLDKPKEIHSEVDLWKMVGDELPGGLFDEGLAKSHGEVLAAGRCYPPNAPQVASYVRVQMGQTDKRLAVIGNRQWKDGVPTQPSPFSEMPVDFAHAFGGDGFERNPLGKGAALVDSGDGFAQPLPNIEPVDGLVRSPGQRPDPASFLPLDLTWPQRTSLMGKDYGTSWLEKRSPGPSVDMDSRYFQLAPRDQQLDGFPRGDEAFLIENMHLERSRIEGSLPPLAGKVFVTQRQGDVERFVEVPTKLETVWFFPNRLRGILVFRGVLPIVEDDAADIVHLVAAIEERSKPKGKPHYERVLIERLDAEDGALLSLVEDDLVPAADDGWLCAGLPTDPGSPTRSSGFAEANMKRRATKIRDDARAEIMSHGLAPGDYGLDEAPEEQAIPGIDKPRELLRFVKEQQARAESEKVNAEAKRDQAHDDARKLAAEHGLDWDAMQSDAGRSGPPRIGVKAQLASMRELVAIAKQGDVDVSELESMANDAQYEARLEEMEAQLVGTYRRGAHFMRRGKEVPTEVRLALREKVIEARRTSGRLADPDLTGADLSGLDLSGMDLSDMFLEGALLNGTDLSGARLDNAVFAYANLTEAKLSGASCRGTNFGSAILSDTSLVEADLSGAIFSRATLHKTDLSGATLDDAELFETVLSNVSFRGASGKKLILLRLDLRGASFREAQLFESAWIECNLEGVDFENAELGKARFIGVKAKGARFRRAHLDRAFIGHGSIFEEAVFEGASMVGASVRSTKLRRSNLRDVRLGPGDLSECDLEGANLDGLDAQGALLIRANLRGASLRRANLLGAILQKADLRGANLEGANLFRSDLSRTHLDRETRIENALVEQARIEPRRQAQ